ncbi:hypothetical protein VR610_09760 [Aquirufa regiilacus]|jgi:hypothetical protein
MQNNRKYLRNNWLVGLILICLIYTLFYIYVQENKAIKIFVPRKIRHIIKFGTTFSVYLIGTYFLAKLKEKWMQQLWHFIHLGLLGILIIFGLYDWIVNPIPKSVREISMVFQEFLISPVLYVAMSLLNAKIEIAVEKTSK